MNKEQLVDELLRYFQKEDERLNRYGLPKTYEEKRHFLRGIINMRMPIEIPLEILELEDELLKLELNEKGIVDSDSIKPIEDVICIWKGDITTLKVEAIVNVCNSSMLGCFIPNHSCLDNDIHTYSGIRLRLTCDNIMHGLEEETGNSNITKAYNLPSDYIIHTVGPIIIKKLTDKNVKELEQCYNSCLDLARKNKIRTIAFPCISTGTYHFPKDKACKIAVNTVKEYLKKYPNSFDKIIFNVYTKEDEDYYLKIFE